MSSVTTWSLVMMVDDLARLLGGALKVEDEATAAEGLPSTRDARDDDLGWVLAEFLITSRTSSARSRATLEDPLASERLRMPMLVGRR
jgi:hypothetical protein